MAATWSPFPWRPGHKHPHPVGGLHGAVSPGALPPGVTDDHRQALGQLVEAAAHDSFLAIDLCNDPVSTVKTHHPDTGQNISVEIIEKLLGVDGRGLTEQQLGEVLRIRIDEHIGSPDDAADSFKLMCGCG